MTGLDVDDLVARLRAAPTVHAVHEEVERAVRLDPTGVLDDEAGLHLLHRSDELTVLHVVLPPGYAPTLPHDHRMWAVVGLFAGREDNEFFRSTGAGPELELSGGRSLRAGDVLAMGAETVHAIANPSAGATSALHVYGGDLLAAERSMWRRDPWRREPYDAEGATGTTVRPVPPGA